jgi:ABC-2 type transport system permease protein
MKLRRSLALLLCVAAPTMVVVLSGLMMLDWNKPSHWQAFGMSTAGLWSFFMLPMTVTALTILMAQLEHGPRFWNHLLALPVARWQIFAAKAVVIIALVALMTMSLLGLIPLTGYIVEAIKPGVQLTGSLDFGLEAKLLWTMFTGSMLLIGIQLWVALYFRSFVPPLVVGIGGTFVAAAATGSKYGMYFPWLLPTSALAKDPARAEFAISLGLWGGAAVLLLMLFFQSRREAQ